MLNLTTTTHYTKKIGRLLIYSLLLAAILSAIYFRFIRKPQAPQTPLPEPSFQQNPAQQSPTYWDVSKVNKLKTPKSLPTFAAKKFALNESIAQETAAAFGFKTTPTSVDDSPSGGKVYAWADENRTFTLNPDTIYFVNSKPQTLGAGRSLEELQDIGRNFILNLPISDKELADNPQINYLSISERGILASTNSFESAQAVELSYDKKLFDIPLVGTSPDKYTAIRITKDGQIIFFSSRFYEGIDQKNTYRIKSTKDALEEIKRGQGKIVQTLIPDENGQTLELFRHLPIDIDSATITNINLAYFLPDDPKEVVQPIFVAIGEFEEKGEKGRITIYLPAIKNLLKSRP